MKQKQTYFLPCEIHNLNLNKNPKLLKINCNKGLRMNARQCEL